MKSGSTDDNCTELKEGQQYLHIMYNEPGRWNILIQLIAVQSTSLLCCLTKL
jgi:hypothetical protein